MKKSLLILIILLVLTATLASSADLTEKQKTIVMFFYGDGCPHCTNVEDSGIFERIQSDNNIILKKYEIYHNTSNSQLFIDLSTKLGISEINRGIPLAIIDCNGNLSYLEGDKKIISNLEKQSKKCEGMQIGPEPNQIKITLGAIVIASLIDSINPCAFGVLIFLMISLLNIGSAKRALKAGLLYSLVVFIVYFLSGLGLFQIMQTLIPVIKYVHFALGLTILVLGSIQLLDCIFPGKFISLRIPPSGKPIIERIAQRGTIPAVMLLGIIVSLFELPCTGGIYIAILTTMSINKTFALGYLLLYNLIFILPLIVITLIIYKGTNPETLQKWTSNEKIWMKLASGLIMLSLGIYILVSS